jgi:hypothetical protein
LYVPGASVAGFTETDTLPGVCPDAGETPSQFPPVDVVALAVNVAAAKLLKTERLWGTGGAASSRRYVKLRPLGAIVRAEGLAVGLIVPL